MVSLPLFNLDNPVAELKPKQLRDYQIEVIHKINNLYSIGKKSVMLVSPTGSGKTLTAVAIIKEFAEKGDRILFIIHREPLVNQTVDTLGGYGLTNVGYIKAGYPHANEHEQIIVASIQTLARRDFPDNIDLVVFDETHTTSFYKTAKELIQYYSESPVLALSKAKFLHLTATPFRLKKKEYFPHVEAIVQAPHIGKLTRMGYLVTARHFGYDGLNDFSKLETGKDGDYQKSQLAACCELPEYNEAIVNKFLDFCPDRKAISFAASVNQSLLLTQLFNDAGIVTRHIQAETTREERQYIFQDFQAGKVQIISSIGTLTEGFDEPSVESVILARPTKSLALLIQMCGRGLRLFPDKKDCFLLDFGENFQRLGRIDTKRKISLCPSKRKDAEVLKDCPQCHAKINNFCQICPECGYVFPEGNKEDDEKEFLDRTFGELFDLETKEQLRYIRSQRKMRFTKGLSPDGIWETWTKKYPNKLLINDWLYGAVFRGDRSDQAQQLFKDYLRGVNPNARPDWLKFHLSLEFNNPNLKNESKKSSYQLPPGLTRSWWQVLKIDSSSNARQVREAYRQKVVNLQYDDELVKILNQAYDQAMYFVEVKLSRDTAQLLNQSSITYAEMIQMIDGHLSRLNWTQEEGRQYLRQKYGQKSRQLLSDEELIEFLMTLSEM